MSDLKIRKATRRLSRLRVALCGTAGSGKTKSSLLIAAGLGGRILVVDTEEGSAELYAGAEGVPEFDCIALSKPYTCERYQQAIEMAKADGYDIVILDSISHAWAGEGGLLEQKDIAAKASKSGNDFAAWRNITPKHNRFVNAMLTYPGHVIATMRSKASYEIIDDGGKKKPVKIGLAPIQREGLDFEFTLVFDMSVDGHIATATKDRTGLFDDLPHQPSADTGKRLLEWLSGAAAPLAETQAPAETVTEADVDAVIDEVYEVCDTTFAERLPLWRERAANWPKGAVAKLASAINARKAAIAAGEEIQRPEADHA